MIMAIDPDDPEYDSEVDPWDKADDWHEEQRLEALFDDVQDS